MPSDLPLISVIMPTYNRAKLIMESVNSVLNQSYKNIELVIVDDGSTDETKALISGIKDERLKFIEAGRLAIGGKIKNLGIKQSSGELIAFIDSDDLWHLQKLELQFNAMKKYNASFSLAGGYTFKNIEEPIDIFYKDKTGEYNGNIFLDIFRSRIAMYTQALLFKRNCLELTGYFKEEGSFSDIHFIASLAEHFEAVVLYENLVFRRLHEDNYIHENWKKSYEEGIAFIKNYRNRIPASISKYALYKTYIRFGEDELNRDSTLAAIGKFMKGWTYHPVTIVPAKKMGKALLRSLRKK